MGMSQKVTVIGLSAVVLVAVVVAVAVSVSKRGDDHHGGGEVVNTSNKAVNALCQPTDYKDACVKSLSSANTEDPKELMKVGFKAATKEIGDVVSKSKTLQDAAKDESTKKAYELCKRLLETSVDDFERSMDRVGNIDASNMKKYVEDLRTWLSGAMNYQETCIDAFENTTGDAAEKMKDLLKTSHDLSSNALAMVTDLTSIFQSLNLKSAGQRRLSSVGGDDLPEWVTGQQRHLLQASTTPNAVVAQDGSGQFKTIAEAVKTVPANNAKPFVIQVKAGVYNEYVSVPRGVNNVVLIGEGATKSKVTGNKNNIDGVKTFDTAPFSVDGDGFMAKDMGFENSAGAAKHQAVALRVSGDRAIFFQCQMDGYQDTLYNHNYRQFYRDCTVTGTIDFIFGDSSSVFQNCKMVVRKPMDNQACMVTAQGRFEPRSAGGNVLQNCTITGEAGLTGVKSYLGRPWKEYSRTIIMQSSIDATIDPEGWAPWQGDFGLATCYFLEYQNRGPGSDTSKRVTWPGIKKNVNDADMQQFTASKFNQADQWVAPSGVPVDAGMVKV